MLFLIEANEKYIDELEQFKNEVLIYDKDNDNQFAGCMGLGNCKSAKEWIEICNLRKMQRHVNRQEQMCRQQPILQSEKTMTGLWELLIYVIISITPSLEHGAVIADTL